jgi:hypothetical protein
MNVLNLIIDFIIITITLFSLLSGILNWKFLPPTFRFVLVLIGVAFITEVIGAVTSHFEIYNLILFNAFIIADIWLNGVIISYLLTNKNTKLSFLVLLIINTMIGLWDIINAKNSRFVTTTFIFECVLFLSFYVIILISQLQPSHNSIFKTPLFWLCMANIVYFACNIPFFSLFNYLLGDKTGIQVFLYQMTHLASFMRYILIGCGFLLCRNYTYALKHASREY